MISYKFASSQEHFEQWVYLTRGYTGLLPLSPYPSHLKYSIAYLLAFPYRYRYRKRTTRQNWVLFTFFGPCIVIYLCNKMKKYAHFLHSFNLIIVSSTCFEHPSVHPQEDLYMEQWICVSSWCINLCIKLVITKKVI